MESLLARSVRLDLFEEISDWNLERSRDSQEIDDGEVSLSPLDAAHVGSVESAAVGEPLLRPASPRSKLPDTRTEGGEIRVTRHRNSVANPSPMRPRPMEPRLIICRLIIPRTMSTIVA